MQPTRKQGEMSSCSPRHDADLSVMNVCFYGYSADYLECIAGRGGSFEWTWGKEHAFLKQEKIN